MDKNSASHLSNGFVGLDYGVALGLVGTIVFFVISGLVSFYNLKALDDGNQRIVRTHVAIVALDELLSRVQDAETGQRGFLLTFNDSYLAPYNAALQAIPAKFDDINRLTADNSGQGQRLPH